MKLGAPFLGFFFGPLVPWLLLLVVIFVVLCIASRGPRETSDDARPPELLFVANLAIFLFGVTSLFRR